MQENITAQERKKIILSGIQPTGVFTIGNYVGAIRNWGLLQEEHDCIYCIADLHGITVRQEPASYRKVCTRALALLLATGLDPKKNIMYMQSHVPAHAELGWLLNCYTYVGELSRMTQFKDKSAKHADNINVGLYDYPVLMAADILLYDTDLVPVGDDQKQHIEITRDIAMRFNNIYGDVFRIPEPYIPKAGARIKSLADPTAKMSKSEEGNGTIFMLDEPDVITRKLKRAVTDSGKGIYISEDKPGISNLINISSAFTGKTTDEIMAECENMNYGDFKLYVADIIIDSLKPIQDEYKRIESDKAYLNEVMKDGAERAAKRAYRMLSKVQKKIGFLPMPR
ncbi:MAG: tryptophan--tRNA ligase [Clostridia bacterium]|nr:tryptophan--tRNA ligase [Clostridia bacterium]